MKENDSNLNDLSVFPLFNVKDDLNDNFGITYD